MTLRSLALACALHTMASEVAAQVNPARPPAPAGAGISKLRVVHTYAGSAISSLADGPKDPKDEVELRVWGSGMEGQRGVVLRRTSGEWRAWRVWVVRCNYDVPIPIADTASPATDSLFERRALETCGGSLDSTAFGHSVYSVDTLGVEPVRAQRLDVVWSQLVDAGVRELPPRYPAEQVLQVDGFTIVIELREGRTYRKSVIYSSIPATSDADRRARLIYNAVDRALPYRTPTAPP